ncbi:hypothetical protein [Burkholderia vietnamiensis]|uniref:hypothetical protein n=1 Tax=Burkholderia vietnamiensis TaxID=60552 RepID=UPI001CF15A22|nr:hypothetical protein [Burkholderia vietnamiensis]MCA8198477.1 hypothetical protein [Burkholderia vietnamiensis]
MTLRSIDAVVDTSRVSVHLPQDAVTSDVAARAARMFHPGGYEITGYVLTQKISSWKAIVDATGVRWMSQADLARIMAWREPEGSGAPPEGADVSDEYTALRSVAPASPVQLPAARPTLTRPASHEQPTDVDAALGELASRLGCVYNDSVPHNCGWFVPGHRIAYASALDAIEGLVDHLKSGGTTYRAGPPAILARPALAPATAAEPRRESGSLPAIDNSQQALF